MEMMAVLAIVLTLTTVGVVGWNTVQRSSTDLLAVNALRGVAGEQQLLERSRGRFSDDATVLTTRFPDVFFVEEALAPGQVSLAVIDGRLGLATVSNSGVCLTLAVPGKDSNDGEIRARYQPGTQTPCTGAHALTFSEEVSPW